MTTATPASEPDFGLDDLDDFMSELDRDLKGDSAKPKKRSAPTYSYPAFVQQWHAHAVTLCVRDQLCICGAVHRSIEGLFFESMTRNGAVQRQRITAITGEHSALPRTITALSEVVSHCPTCFTATPQESI